MSNHPPVQLYSEYAANVACVLALGIMATAGVVLTTGMLLGGFYVKVADGVQSGVTVFMISCILSIIPPMGITLSFLGKVKADTAH